MSLRDGKVVQLICQGDGDYKYLDGDPSSGKVYLESSPDGHAGSRWKVKLVEGKRVALQCLGEGKSIWRRSSAISTGTRP